MFIILFLYSTFFFTFDFNFLFILIATFLKYPEIFHRFITGVGPTNVVAPNAASGATGGVIAGNSYNTTGSGSSADRSSM